MEIQDNINNLRVASFSAYLNSSEENFVLKLAGGIQDPMPESEIFSTPKSLGRPETKEGEIGVFGADKYFNMTMDHEKTPEVLTDNSRIKKEDQFDQRHDAKNPSVVSPEASWNSQAALLPSLPKKAPRNKQKKAVGKRFFAGFGCNGPCLDKKSVHINEGVHRKGMRKESLRSVNPVLFDGTKESESGLRGGENFAFPILKPGEENLTVKKQLEEEPRHSIEVFGSHSIKKGDIAMNLERKLSVLTWDAIPKAQNIQSNLGSGGPCDDVQSDASSDLFELETVCGTGHPLMTMQASELTTQYEPSEASIEWSLVTATMADYDEKSTDKTSKMVKTKNVVCKEGQKGRPGGLLGCKTHKSVSVAETAYRTTEKAK